MHGVLAPGFRGPDGGIANLRQTPEEAAVTALWPPVGTRAAQQHRTAGGGLQCEVQRHFPRGIPDGGPAPPALLAEHRRPVRPYPAQLLLPVPVALFRGIKDDPAVVLPPDIGSGITGVGPASPEVDAIHVLEGHARSQVPHVVLRDVIGHDGSGQGSHRVEVRTRRRCCPDEGPVPESRNRGSVDLERGPTGHSPWSAELREG
ncbi:hypothetical protein PJL18_04068 [Paenarthrobacter nicotinovorans]|nr:hypothetical protein [Paenarthrobacter nicotinovorans]